MRQLSLSGNFVNNKSDKLLVFQIATLQGFYWMIYCPIASFASVYLLSRDVTNQNIGWIMAISNVLAIILQPALGALIDRYRKISVKTVLCILSTISIVLLIGLNFLDAGLIWMAVFYVGIVALLYTAQPMVNALVFEYINIGRNVSFGMTRAAGSICFAVLSTLLGIWVKQYSTSILPIFCLVSFVIFLGIVLSFPKVKRVTLQPDGLRQSTNDTNFTPKVGFLRRYDRFIPFLIGIACLFLFHTVINTFLAQILKPLGGVESDFGISLTIAAIAELPAFLGFSFIVAKINTRSLIKIAGVFYALRGIIFLLASSVWMVNVGQAFQGLSFAIFIPASVYYINEIMREEDRVKGQTFITGTITLGSFFGSVIGGWLLDRFNIQIMLTFAAVGAILGCVLLFYSIRKPAAKKLELEPSNL
jgi:MFS transporter, PPP family, 3-phenylpropionic acid transporter